MIEDKRKTKQGKICFDKLSIGTVFEMDNTFYMKVRSDIKPFDPNAINLNLRTASFFDETPIQATIVNAKIVIED
jgi:hypothetical protein